MRDSGWGGRVIPTFRPDTVVNIDAPGWPESIDRLNDVSGVTVGNFSSYVGALEQRREFFKSMGATATDHAALTAYTERLNDSDADRIFQRALQGEATTKDAARFTGHMLIEMARMSSDDGLVMQLHIGSWRNHNPQIYRQYGRDMGADIPIRSEFTKNLKPLLDRFGNQRDMTLVLFNLDETTYSRELAPLAGHYPILRLGPPWWFFDSWLGMTRFLDDGGRDGWHLQSGRLQRRYPRLPLNSGAARCLAPGLRRLAGRTTLARIHRRRRRLCDDSRAGVRLGQRNLPIG